MKEIRIKCVFLGNEATGKTSIVERYTKGTFNIYTQSTIGASFNAKPIIKKDLKIKLDIWDTAGQERYRSMTPMYYRNADVAFICVDLSSIDITNVFKYWYDALKTNLDNSRNIVYLVGTKSDIKTEKNEQTISNLLELYQSVKYIETSSKENKNISKLFEDAVDDVIINDFANNKMKETNVLVNNNVNINKGGGMLSFCNVL
jgi:small GTP-binding protein